MSMIPAPNVVHVLHDRIIGLKNEISRNALALGGALAEMRDHDLYRELGYPTFEDYLVSDAVRMHRTTAYSFMRIYQSFHLVEREAIKLDWRKLDILTQIIKEGESPERILPMLEQAAAMPREELRAGVRAGKQQRMIAPTVSEIPDTVPAPIEASPVAYPVNEAPEWQPAPPIEANYTVSDEDVAADLAPPSPFRSMAGTSRATNAVQTIIDSGRDDYIAQDFNRLVAYLLGSTDIAPRVVRNFTTTDVARVLTRDEVAGLRRAIPVMEFALGVYADFERQNLRVVR